jgi:transcriptional regulator with XRE-family HTH domain
MVTKKQLITRLLFMIEQEQSQKVVARRLGVSPQKLSMVLTGYYNPQPEFYDLVFQKKAAQ